MAKLGGSPLGLINVTAGPLNGFTSFNSKNERNINVNSYNIGNPRASGFGNSIFTGGRIVRAWPGINEYQSTFAGIPDGEDGQVTSQQFKFNPQSEKEHKSREHHRTYVEHERHVEDG